MFGIYSSVDFFKRLFGLFLLMLYLVIYFLCGLEGNGLENKKM